MQQLFWMWNLNLIINTLYNERASTPIQLVVVKSHKQYGGNIHMLVHIIVYKGNKKQA